MSAKETPITILIAEDDAEDQKLIREALAGNRLANHLYFVNDGEELLDYLHRRGKYSDPGSAPYPGIVLLDLNMPRKDGREALKLIRANPALNSLPVIVLTTSEAEEDIEQCYSLGANSYITKPVSFADLLKTMQAVTRYWV
ncbi:MAG: response regulator, partial [Candidatus Binatia bacterium]